MNPEFGAAYIAAVTTDAIQVDINRLAEQGYATNTIRRINGVLRGVMTVAVRRRYIATNPCDALDLPAADDHVEMLFLDPAEIHTLVAALPVEWRTPVYLAATVGLRAGEVWGLRRMDVDLLTGTLYVRQTIKANFGKHLADLLPADQLGLVVSTPKSRASRRKVALPEATRRMLADHLSSSLPSGPAASAVIFTLPGGTPVQHGNFYARIFKPTVRACLPPEKAGLRFHDLRHSAAALSLAVHPDLFVVKSRLGHSDIKPTINT
ncbi:MAG: tyrosine-type recombinase/integrase [Solirubrobacteraceae bacterium]